MPFSSEVAGFGLLRAVFHGCVEFFLGLGVDHVDVFVGGAVRHDGGVVGVVVEGVDVEAMVLWAAG